MSGPASFGLCDEAVDETTHVVSPKGEVDLVTAPQLGRCLLGLADDRKTGVVVDLSSVTFIDSTGLGVLLNALKALASRHGKMVLVCPNERVLRPFQVTGLADRIPIFPSREAAIGGLAA
jgi:anti-sigma B factor antagonist